MSTYAIGLMTIPILLILFILGIPIAYAMAIIGFVGFWYLSSFASACDILAKDLYWTFNSYSLSVVPVFVWMGFLAYYTGISTKLFSAADKWIGQFKGGLSMATIAACTAFGAICGSTTATAGAMGMVALPEMKRYGYDVKLATGTVAAGAILGILIPPSIVFIIYGFATEVSIGALFIAGIVPGILLAILYIVVVYVQVKINPNLAPQSGKTTFKEKLLALIYGGVETIIIFIVVIGALAMGIVTPTEAGALGSFAILIVALIKRSITWKNFIKSISDTTATTIMIMFIIAGATILGRFIAISRIPFLINSWTSTLAIEPILIMLIIYVIYLMLGMFIDALPMILLTIPIFFPTVLQLGFDPIWFGVITVLVGGMGTITPPVGINVYVIKALVPETPLSTVFGGIWPFVGAIFICLAILTIFPDIATFLPKLFGY